jgi:transposase
MRDDVAHQLIPVSSNQEETEMDATTVAVDLAKTVFELAIANADWRVVARQRLNRAQFTRFLAETPATHVVMEACGMAHYWGRLAQQQGHRVTLLPPAYVRPYVRRSKTDRADAEAILEAVRSGQVPSVPVKRVEQQALVAVHRVRAQWMSTRTARINALRGILREQGLLLPAGARAALLVVPTMLEDAEAPLPMHLRQILASVHEEVRAIEARIADLERALHALADADPVVTRLRTIPGVGLLTATALVGSVGHIHAFRRARQFGSWLGLTPREHSGIDDTSGGSANAATSTSDACSRTARVRCWSARNVAGATAVIDAATTRPPSLWPINSAASCGPSGTRDVPFALPAVA